MSDTPAAAPRAAWRRALPWIAALAALALASALFVSGQAAAWMRAWGLPAGPAASFAARDVTAEGWNADLRMQDGSGRSRDLAQFRGKLVVLTFGYTNCPDYCPTTLAKLAEVRRLLGADGARLQVLFVTVDPERDTGAVLDRYVPSFDPSFIGLRGDEDQTDAATQAFHASYQIVHYRGQVMVEHTSASYVIDPQGRTRLVSPYDQTAASLAEDLGKLLRAG